MGNFTWVGVRGALALLAALLIGMTIREYARAWAAARLHDPTPRLWGRLSLNPRVWFDPFGSGLVPGLLAILWAANAVTSPVAYGKPAPVDPSYFRQHRRDVVLVSLAGPAATLALAFVAGIGLRVVREAGSTELTMVLGTMTFAFAGLTVFHLLPIPGLDGARIVALFLPPAAAQVYRNADKYLALFVLVLIFIFGSFVRDVLTNAVCTLAAGSSCL